MTHTGRRAIAIPLAIAVASLALAAQTPANPFPNHEEPPAGWFCSPALHTGDTTHDAHACTCLGMTMEPHCGTKDENEARQESHACKTWCHRDHCHCARTCADSN